MACRRLRRTRTFRFPPFRYNKRNHPVLFFVSVYAETVLTHATAGWRERHMPRHDDKPTNRPSKPMHDTRNGGPLYKGGRGEGGLFVCSVVSQLGTKSRNLLFPPDDEGSSERARRKVPVPAEEEEENGTAAKLPRPTSKYRGGPFLFFPPPLFPLLLRSVST